MNYIYRIKNNITNKSYIGITNNIYRRYHRHFSELRNNKHDNNHLQRSFNKYGEDNFKFIKILELECSREELYELEKQYISEYNSYNSGYNQNIGGVGSNGFMSKITVDEAIMILSILDNRSKSGSILAEKFKVTRTTISRIKRGESHEEAYSQYHKLTSYDKKLEFEKAVKELDIKSQLASANNKTVFRKFEDATCYTILSYLEFDKYKIKTQIASTLNIDISTINNFCKDNSYRDIKNTYHNYSRDERESYYNQIKDNLKIANKQRQYSDLQILLSLYLSLEIGLENKEIYLLLDLNPTTLQRVLRAESYKDIYDNYLTLEREDKDEFLEMLLSEYDILNTLKLSKTNLKVSEVFKMYEFIKSSDLSDSKLVKHFNKSKSVISGIKNRTYYKSAFKLYDKINDIKIASSYSNVC